MKFWCGERVRFTKNVTNTMTSISNVGCYTYILIESLKFFYVFYYMNRHKQN